MNLNINQILNRFPLRIAITDYCNIDCQFCSNEGMGKAQRNKKHANIDSLTSLIEILAERGLKQVSITGGDPSLYPYLVSLTETLEKNNIERMFIHTNGIALTPAIIQNTLSKFTKIGISVHAFEYEIWGALTGGSRSQYNQVLKNLDRMIQAGYQNKMEVKHVPMMGINDTEEVMKKTLDYCALNKLKFKFLNFEPIVESHVPLVKPIEQIIEKLERIGCIPITREGTFREQEDYLPINWFSYRGTKGVAIEIGCGNPEICRFCYNSNEICLTPELSIKPCNMSGKSIPLEEDIKNHDSEEICRKIVNSRVFLQTMPGANRSYWYEGDFGDKLAIKHEGGIDLKVLGGFYG